MGFGICFIHISFFLLKERIAFAIAFKNVLPTEQKKSNKFVEKIK